MSTQMPKIEIKEWYDHEHSHSVFVIFDKQFNAHWCPSGNELRRIYLEDPANWISGPLELPIPEDLEKYIFDAMDNE